MDTLKVYIEDALKGNARIRGSAKRVPVYKHFNLDHALDALEIYLEPRPTFEDGIVGWSAAHYRSIAVRPGYDDPVKVAFHEIAHILLPQRRGRTNARTKAVDEVEAELTAFLVKRCLRSKIYLPRARSYIQDQMKKARPLKPRLELVQKAALEVLEAGRTYHRVSPGIIGLGLAVANRDYGAAERSANVFWAKREREPDARLPMVSAAWTTRRAQSRNSARPRPPPCTVDRQAISRFKRDYRCEKSGFLGKKLDALLIETIDLLPFDRALPRRYFDHPLSGEWSGFRDCHIRPDARRLRPVRLGSHSELGF